MEMFASNWRTVFFEMSVATQYIGARLASKEAKRTHRRLIEQASLPTFFEIKRSADEIDSRLRDELEDIHFAVLDQNQSFHLGPANQLVNWDVMGLFPSAALEVEEAAKCYALGRSTACVFHCMRLTELGLKAFSKFLGIEDPTKPAEKNWNFILRKVKEAIDSQYPQAARLGDSDGAKCERIYASADAIKNPWRNATMHVDTVYTQIEARHILACTDQFMHQLSVVCDEKGRAIARDLFGNSIYDGLSEQGHNDENHPE